MLDKTARKPKDKMTGNDLADTINLWSIASELGVKFAVPLVIFMLIGIKVDRTLQTTPLFMIAGVVLSMALSVYFVYDILKRVNKESK